MAKQQPMNGKERKAMSDEWRTKIQTGMIIYRCNEHIKGNIELSATQVKCAQMLLNKVLPDLKAVEHSGEVDVNHVTGITRTIVDVTPDRPVLEHLEAEVLPKSMPENLVELFKSSDSED